MSGSGQDADIGQQDAARPIEVIAAVQEGDAHRRPEPYPATAANEERVISQADCARFSTLVGPLPHRCVHLFPFEPWGVDGGTLRLRTSIEGSGAFDDVAVGYWGGECWHTTAPSEVTATRLGAARMFRADSFKRRLFPSTLWESGRRAVGAFDCDLVRGADAVVVHTTYLGDLIPKIRRVTAAPVILDVYDLIWRVHRLDAALTRHPGYRTIRRLYSRSVRPREERALRSADAVACAGWTDLQHLPDDLPIAEWLPTGLEGASAPLPSGDELRVGLIGSFAHSATVDAANTLVELQRSSSTEFSIVVAGAFSGEWAAGQDGITALGRVADIADFYREVHASVVPVGNGSGMKCKLAESILSGRPVITTPAGAEGFPPHLSRFLATDASSALEPDRLRTLLNQQPSARRAFDVVSRSQAAAGYADLLARFVRTTRTNGVG